MARLFGALANAGAQVNTNRFKRQQYDDQQAAQAREEARRVFEFAALQKDRQEQAKAAAQEREQARLFQAQEAGYADAPDVAGVRAGGAAMAAMGGFHTNAEQAVAQEDAPFQREVEGVQYQAPKVASQYLTIGGKTLRKNRQSEANAAKDAEAQKFMAQVVMNKDIKSQLQMQRDIAAGERAGAANQTREIVAGIAAAAAANRPQRKYGKYFTNPKTGQTLWVDEGENPPDGFLQAGAGATKATAAATPGVNNPTTKTLYTNYRKEEPVKTAMAVAGPIRSINAALEQGISTGNRTAMLSAIYQVAKLNDPRTGVRPSELELVGETVGLDERLRRTISKWNSGKMLTPDMINDIQSFVAEQQSMASEAVKPTQALYGQMLRDSGLESDSAYVAPSPIQSRKPSPTAGGRKPFSQRLQEDGK